MHNYIAYVTERNQYMLSLTTPIESSITISLAPLQLERIRRIDAEDFTGVAKKVRREMDEHGRTISDDMLAAGIYGLRQYYAIALLDPMNPHAVSPLVDPFWHAHILHTREYAAFCDDVMGDFMHHEPLDHDNHADVAALRMLYEYTVQMMPRIFDIVDEKIWPTKLADAGLICKHFGNTTAYPAVAAAAQFPPQMELQSVG